MFKNIQFNDRLIFIFKCLLISYVLTAGLLFLLALMLYRLSLSEEIVSIGIIIVYVLVTFLAGFLFGKREGNRKFLWGLLIGLLYFSVLLIISLVINQGFGGLTTHFLTVLVLCCGSGMLGGMIS